jgi:hypothetical protein
MVLEGETEVLEENLPRRHFVQHKFHLPDPGANPGRRGGKPATNSFSYGAALCFNRLTLSCRLRTQNLKVTSKVIKYYCKCKIHNAFRLRNVRRRQF